ncbi:MAG: helix-turn-helix transcriptional regulator [Erysipelotrichaceae bacterium]|nr:helix-turn-helix transcriptional regulator [Erysipelotrichaceae bacterium]
METKRKLGKYIAELRISRGLAKSELAERVGVSENTIDRWESSRLLPSKEELKKLADALKVSAEELLNSTAHGPLPEKGIDLSYEQQAARRENLRYLLLAGFIAAGYGVLYLLATRTDLLAGLFPALIALTVTVMIGGLFLLGKAVHGTLYTRTDWRRYLLAGFCLIVVPLTFIDWMNYQIQKESQGKTDVPVSLETLEEYAGLKLDGCELTFSYENSGWFGSGTRVYILQCPEEKILTQISENAGWNPLPADASFQKLIDDNIHYGPEGQGLPQVNEGYYRIACNTGEEVVYIADPEAGVRDFVAVIYDSSSHLLYIARYSS